MTVRKVALVLEMLTEAQGSEPWSPPGVVTRTRFERVDLMVGAVVDEVELGRRRRNGVGALTRRGDLELLVSMPDGVELPADMFSAADRTALRKLSGRAVEIDGTVVRRLARPPLSLLNVGVTARTWRQGSAAVGPFASYCARYVVLEPVRKLDDMSLPTIEARFYGVGLAVLGGDTLDWYVAPAPFRADRFSSSSWMMAERMAVAVGAI